LNPSHNPSGNANTVLHRIHKQAAAGLATWSKSDDFIRPPAGRDVFVNSLPDSRRTIFGELFVLETERGHVSPAG